MRTQIICTLGPASGSKDVIVKLAQSGMRVARCNMAHGTQEDHRKLISLVREVGRELERPIDVMVDIKGPEIRTGDVGEPLKIAKGQEVMFSPRPHEFRNHPTSPSGLRGAGETRPIIEVNYDAFAEDVKEAEQILVDGGELAFTLKAIEGWNVVAVAKGTGTISSRRHINLPGADVDLPAITAKDWGDLKFALDNDVDMIALSFVRSSDNVTSVRRFLEGHEGDVRQVGHVGKPAVPKVVAKIETRQALNDLTAIVQAADLVMVARGDLGCEVPLEKIPQIQDEIVKLCRDTRKPVIVATHLLESMIDHPVPSRAELTDIAHAVETGADYVMLSGETAHGSFPVEAVATMRRVIDETERQR